MQLNAELGRLYARLGEVSRQLADEQALTRDLYGVIALLPYNAVRRPRLVPLNPWLPRWPPARRQPNPDRSPR